MENEHPTADNANSGDIVETPTSSKERALYMLRLLIELIENDRIRVDALKWLTNDEILARAEAAAAKAVEGSEALKNS